MFTGVIKETGRIIKIEDNITSRVIKVGCSKILKNLNTSDSISVNGVCLTVTGMDSRGFTCDVSFNTIKNTSLGNARTGDIVNLEDSLTGSDKLGGHFVNGHVDCTAAILKIVNTGEFYTIEVELPPEIRDFIALNGSVAVDGISLTVAGIKSDSFSLVIIPYTFKNTNLSRKTPGDSLNIEADMLARYVVNFLKTGAAGNFDSQKNKDEILKEKLRENGFTE
jgi:riboflavin synthase